MDGFDILREENKQLEKENDGLKKKLNSPLYKSAPAMLEALKAIIQDDEKLSSFQQLLRNIDIAEKAIEQAEKKL